VVPAPTTTTLVVNSGPSSTTLQALVSSSTGASVDGGTVSFYDGTTLLGVAAVVDGSASLIYSALSEGSHTLSAVFSGTANVIGSSASQVVNQGTDQAVVGLSRYGVRNQPTILELYFGQTMNPAQAEWKRNYQLRDRDGDRIRIAVASYNAATNSVKLYPYHKLSLHGVYSLRVLGLSPKTSSKVSSPNVATSGWLANNFRTAITQRALSVTGASPAVNFVNGQEVAIRR
jgi:hypothetical protein